MRALQPKAVDKTGRFVSAKNAVKGSNYWCPHCGGAVRRRGGLFRRPHFFHLAPSHDCQGNGKGIVHTIIQEYLEEMLPGAELEVQFPSIRRIADVVWEEMKIVFEVQCAAITAEEVMARNADYRSEGYEVVWILHDHRYNKSRPQEVELALTHHPHYFTNVDQHGVGTFYDQLHLFRNQCRVPLYRRDPVDFRHPIRSPSSHPHRRWNLHFKGDILNVELSSPSPPFRFLASFYSYFLRLLLKACSH